MRLLFIGTVRFSLAMLEALVDAGSNLVGVIAGENNGLNADYADLKPLCERHGIPLHVASDVNSMEVLAWVRRLEPDIIFCMGWSRLLKEELLSLPSLGVIGYHPAALPKNRGRHPLVWALALGLKETASSFFFMDEGTDSGDLLSQVLIPISPEDDAASLYDKVIKTAKAQIPTILSELDSGDPSRTPQDNVKSNSWRKRGVADGKIDWRMSATSIHNLIRALSHPYVGAHFILGEKEVKVWKADVISYDGICNIEPGKVIGINGIGAAFVKCGEGCLELTEIEPKVVLSKGDYL